MRICANCGEDNSERARFCQACAAALPDAATPAAETRKTVTVVFADVTGSTALGERLDPESLRHVMERYFDAMKAVIERHGGSVEKFIGDAVMAVFGIPRLHEDDALRAVRAAEDMRSALTVLNHEFEAERGVTIAIRTGVNTGEVVAGSQGGGQRLVTGDAVNTAARLEQAAQPGEILIGDATFRLVRDAVTVEAVEAVAAKGKAEPVPAYRLIGVTPGVASHARHLDSPMIGRDRERRMLSEALDRAASERTCLLFTVLGPAGVGKSRLVHEFLADASARATVLRGRCLSYGEGITFWPLAEAVRQAAGVVDTDSAQEARSKLDGLVAATDDGPLVADLVAALVGLAPAGAAGDDASWAVRRLFETLAADRPLIVVFDDIHWAEPTFLDLIEHIADWSREAPILLLCVARPELLELRPAWGGGKMNAASILLEALGQEECAGLIDNLVGGTALPREARDRILESAEGNPLFVEEMLAMLIDDGLITFADGRWTANDEVARVAVPPTIQLLLAARLDRLDAEERAMVELGSVEGKVFHRGAVAAMAPEHVRPNVRLRLLALTRKELIRPDRATFAGEDAFRFRHLLIRDAAYQGLPKESRARLHEAFAAWLQDVPGERRTEYEDIVGYHLEQAYRYREELGTIDEHARGLAVRAGEALAAAGRRAAARHDPPAGANLLLRAGELLPTVYPDRLQILIEAVSQLIEAGRFEDAYRLTSRVKTEAHEVGDRRAEARADLDQNHLILTLDPSVPMERAAELAHANLAVLEEAGDRYGVMLARLYLNFYTFVLGRAGEASEIGRQIVEEALATGDELFIGMSKGTTGSLFFGPAPADEAVAFVQAFGDRLAEFPLPRLDEQRALIGLLGMVGRFDEARELAKRIYAANELRGRMMAMASVGFFEGPMERMAGDLFAAETVYRRSYDLFERMGDRGFLSTIAAELGEVVWWLGKVEEAERLADIARSMTAEDDMSSLMGWRTVKARVLAHRGEFDVAETLAREAVEIGLRTDYLSQTGDAWFALGEVLRMASRPSEAAMAFGEALVLFRRKGNIPQARQAEAEMRASGGSPA